MRNTQRILLSSIYTLLFSALIFVGMSIFFSENSEEDYIEITRPDRVIPLDMQEDEFQSFSGVTQKEVNTAIHELIYQEFTQKYEEDQRNKISINYVPYEFQEKIRYSYLPLVESFLYQKNILSLIRKIEISLQKESSDTRWRMKSQIIYMYGVLSMSDEEFLSVLIHEFAHYIDIYTFPKSSFWDESQRFYDISWESPTVMQVWLNPKDFVSWYAMTNQYEDFAESYVYYVLHNRDFLEKVWQSDILAKKYDYFQRYIFTKNLFYKEDFSLEDEVRPYYWDITKLGVDVKKFLQYMQRDI